MHPVTKESLVEILTEWTDAASPKKAYYVNAHAVNLAHDDEGFRDSLNRADLVFCDGYGVRLASRLAGEPLPARLTPPDWIDDLLSASAARKKSVFLLGDEPGVAQKCAAIMKSRVPSLVIAGTHHGFFDIDKQRDKEAVRAVRDSGAALLLVGMGMPRQERWIDKHLAELNVPLVVPVGAMFRWYAGVDRRAPKWVTDHGMEWLARFVRHPIRHFKRYAIGNPRFLIRALRRRFGRSH